MVAVAGYSVGRWSYSFAFPLGFLAFLGGGLLGLAGLCQKPVLSVDAWRERIAAACLLTYIVILGVEEPLEFVWSARDVFVAVVWLSPLICGGVLLPKRELWLAGLGCWFVLFSGMVALSFNLSHGTGGMGFLSRWME